MGLQSSVYMLDIEAKFGGILAGVDILTNPLIITSDLQASSGLIRIYFALETVTTPYQITVTRIKKGNGAEFEAKISAGQVSGITVINSGGTYEVPTPLIVDNTDTGGGGLAGTVVLSHGKVSDTIITNPGSGYVTPPKITIAVVSTSESFKLNADKNFDLLSLGLYRFDIGVHAKDELNFTCNSDITDVDEFRIDQIQIGA